MQRTLQNGLLERALGDRHDSSQDLERDDRVSRRKDIDNACGDAGRRVDAIPSQMAVGRLALALDRRRGRCDRQPTGASRGFRNQHPAGVRANELQQ